MKKTSVSSCSKIAPEIYRIVLPMPGEKPGPVNAYLFLGKQVTLLDTGMLRTLDTLRSALGKIGISFSDIRQIVLTHGHFDHHGAARRIVQEAGGNVVIAAHEEDKKLIEHGRELSLKQYDVYFRLMGVPFLYRILLDIARRIFAAYSEHTQIDRFISDGETIQMGDYEARVVEVPGHTRGSISLYLEKENILFSGDHILGHITPNAFVMLEPDIELPRRSSQAEFYDSLSKIEELSPATVFPAHGDPVSDLAGTIAGYRKRFSERKKRIQSVLGAGDFTVYQIARKLFPYLGRLRFPLELILAVSEVYTHLQVLEKEKAIAWEVKHNALTVRQIRA